MRLETTIISNLLTNESYARKVLPFIKTEYFPDKIDNVIIDELTKFVTNYSSFPTKEILLIQSSNRQDLSEDNLLRIADEIHNLSDEKTNEDWLLSETEKYFKERAVYNAILDSIQIIEGKNEKFTQEAIPSILSDALGICFNRDVGHDYIKDSDSRYEFYHREEERLPFNLEILDKITNGGLPKKSLTSFMAGPGVGKSLVMCHFAASTLLQNKNVLYITLEMSEERISERIDANLLNLGMMELKTVEYSIFNKRIKQLQSKTNGTLIVKEYPTASAHVGHFRALLDELKIKKDFKPNLIIIDYLNICSSQRLKFGSGVNSYGYVKAIVEEIRGLAVEYDVPIMTATQTNREGISNSDVEMTNVSESIGTAQTLDLMLAIISTEELESLGQIMIKQLKNRYNSIDYYKKFVIGIDRNKMRLFDVEEVAQNNITPEATIVPTSNSTTNSTKNINTNGFKF